MKVGTSVVTASQSEEERILTGTPSVSATQSIDASGSEELSGSKEVSATEEASAQPLHPFRLV